AQEAVRPRHLLRVLPADIAAGGERPDRAQRRRDAQPLIGPAVYELQQLYGEFDIAQSPATELDVPLDAGRRQRTLAPAAHFLHVGDEMRSLRGRPDHRLDQLGESGADFGIAGDRAGFEERLELPGTRPAPVIGLAAADRAYQSTLPALGP